MSAVIIDGKAVSASVLAQVKDRAASVRERLGRAPKLAVVLVGEDPASKIYVSSKSKKAHESGIDTIDRTLSAQISDHALQLELGELSNDPSVDGILLQLPLPRALNEFKALLAIAPEKDVDGLHPMNQGLLSRGAECHNPCTPRGSMVLIDRARELLGQTKDLSGLHATVVGRSVLVGKPVGLMLLARNCTVSYCHSKTRDLASECRRADILVAAVGRPEMLDAEYIKPGAIVIDVGINRLDGKKVVGDVNFESAAKVAGAITPVPGGVGPMTIAMLLDNTVNAAERRI